MVTVLKKIQIDTDRSYFSVVYDGTFNVLAWTWKQMCLRRKKEKERKERKGRKGRKLKLFHITYTYCALTEK